MTRPETEAYLKLTEGHSSVTAWSLTDAISDVMVTVGTDSSCSWRIRAAGVAEMHLAFYWDGRALWVSDPHGAGVAVNGSPIGDWIPLYGRAQVVFGQAVVEADAPAGVEASWDAQSFAQAAHVAHMDTGPQDSQLPSAATRIVREDAVAASAGAPSLEGRVGSDEQPWDERPAPGAKPALAPEPTAIAQEWLAPSPPARPESPPGPVGHDVFEGAPPSSSGNVSVEPRPKSVAEEPPRPEVEGNAPLERVSTEQRFAMPPPPERGPGLLDRIADKIRASSGARRDKSKLKSFPFWMFVIGALALGAVSVVWVLPSDGTAPDGSRTDARPQNRGTGAKNAPGSKQGETSAGSRHGKSPSRTKAEAGEQPGPEATAADETSRGARGQRRRSGAGEGSDSPELSRAEQAKKAAELYISGRLRRAAAAYATLARAYPDEAAYRVASKILRERVRMRCGSSTEGEECQPPSE